jgi:hypothetical protein
MIQNVIWDLRIFLIFYMILIVMFSLIVDIIQKNDEAGEYEKIGFFSGGILTTLRLSLGDFDFKFIEESNLD